MSAQPSNISVVICAYTDERWDDLVAAVASLGRQTRPPRDAIVVIDGNEALLARARAELPNVRVVANDRAPGLSGARVTGATLASTPIVAFLDDDAVADERWLEKLEEPYADPRVLGVGGRVDPLWRGRRPSWLAPEFYWIVGCTWAGMGVNGSRIRNPIGANMSMRADVLARTGEFEPELGRLEVGGRLSGTADETEFCLRASRLHPGCYWIYAPDALVAHAVAPQRCTWRHFVRRCRLEGAAKAVVIELAGTRDGLGSEMTYARSVLPRAILRELRRALAGDRDGWACAGAITAGVLITGAEFGLVTARRSIAVRRAARAARAAR